MAVPASVTRRVSEGDDQEMFDIRREHPGVRLGAKLSLDIERRRPSLTQRVTGTADERMHPQESPSDHCLENGRQRGYVAVIPELAYVYFGHVLSVMRSSHSGEWLCRTRQRGCLAVTS